MGKKLELHNQKFYRLQVIEEVAVYGKSYWRCRCDCGVIKTIRGTFLVNGRTKSCGCLAIEKAKEGKGNLKHGKYWTKEYRSWKAMRNRCNTKSNVGYKNYGGRGIEIHHSWNDFTTFLNDMGPSPSEAHTIERINNNVGYQFDNCRWATTAEQSRNTRRNRIIELNGETKLMVDWIELYDLTWSTLSHRLSRGWNLEEAITTPRRKVRK